MRGRNSPKLNASLRCRNEFGPTIQTEGEIEMADEFKKSEQPFEHLVRALQEGEARRISQCIEEIDHRLLDCGRSLEEYRRLRSTLRMINTQLSQLGEQPLAVGDELPTQDLSEVIRSRIENFKTNGKL